MRFRANASCVEAMLFVMYGRSRTSSFGLTTNPLTYQATIVTSMYTATAGARASTIHRSRGAATALTAQASAPSTSAIAT